MVMVSSTVAGCPAVTVCGLTLRTTCAACGFSAYLDKYDLAMTGPKLGANLLEAYNRFHSNGESLA